MLMGFCGIIAAILATSQLRLSNAAKEYLVLSTYGGGASLMMCSMSLIFIGIFPTEAAAWQLLSASAAVWHVGMSVAWWVRCYRLGLRAPLIFTVGSLLCAALFALNAIKLTVAWPFIGAVGGFLFLVGWVNFYFLMYEIQPSASKRS